MNISVDKIKINKNKTMAYLVAVIVIIVAIILVDQFYFEPQTQIMENLVVTPDIGLDVEKSQAQFKAIQDDLLNNDQFLALKKFTAWPLSAEMIIAGNSLPFLVIEKEVEVTAEDTTTETPATEVEPIPNP